MDTWFILETSNLEGYPETMCLSTRVLSHHTPGEEDLQDLLDQRGLFQSWISHVTAGEPLPRVPDRPSYFLLDRYMAEHPFIRFINAKNLYINLMTFTYIGPERIGFDCVMSYRRNRGVRPCTRNVRTADSYQ